MVEQLSNSLDNEWQKVCSYLEKEQGNKLASRLLKRVVPNGMEANEVCLSVPTTCIHEFIKQNYAEQLLSLWKQENPEVLGIKFKLESQIKPKTTMPKPETPTFQFTTPMPAPIKTETPVPQYDPYKSRPIIIEKTQT